MTDTIDTINPGGGNNADRKFLKHAKQEESTFLSQGVLKKVKIQNGYVYTTEPDLYEKLNTQRSLVRYIRKPDNNKNEKKESKVSYKV
jgi:hypothetical protein